MALGLGMRTIWIALRAINYTDYAFNAAIRNLSELQKKEIEQYVMQKRLASATIRTGMMYAVMGGMILGSLFYIMKFSREGSQFMSSFQQKTERALGRVGEAFFKIMKPTLELIASILDAIAENRALARFVAILGITIGTVLLFSGSLMILRGALGQLKSMFAINAILAKSYSNSMVQAKLTTDALVASTMRMMILFLIFYQITSFLIENFGVMPALIIMVAATVAILAVMLWKAATAMSVLTFGIAAIAGIGAAIAAYTQMGELAGYQLGTRFVPYTGLALVHEGEIIYNPSTGRPTGIGESRPVTSKTEITISIGEVHTKSDIDDLDERIRVALREALKERE